MYYNPKKDAPERQSVPPNQASTFLQTPVRFLSFNQKNKTRKPINVTRSNTTSTTNSMIRLGRVMPQRKRSAGNNSLGMKNADSSTAISRISNEDLNSLQSEALSFNYKSTPIALRKYSFRGQTPADDQQSLINFEKFPDLAQLNQLNSNLNSVSSSADSSTNQPMLAAYLQQSGANTNGSRFSVNKPPVSPQQPHQLMSQLNQKLSQLDRNGPYYPNYGHSNYPNYSSNYQANNQTDDAMSTVSTISGLQMHPITNLSGLEAMNNAMNKANLLERANSKVNETKVTIEDDKLPPLPPQTTAIFNANNYVDNDAFAKPIDALLANAVAATKEANQPSVTEPLSIKIDETSDLERIDEEHTLVPDKENKELVTIAEEKVEEPISQPASLSGLIAPTVRIEPSESETSKDRLLDKKLPVDLIYEPNLVSNSSQESLSPFQSNQNTVTSFADFMEQSKKDEETKNEGV